MSVMSNECKIKLKNAGQSSQQLCCLMLSVTVYVCSVNRNFKLLVEEETQEKEENLQLSELVSYLMERK